jgi:single-strand DNA-binding protein
MNRVFLQGHLGGAVTFKTLETGTNTASFSLATNRVWYDADNKKVQRTDWRRCVGWNGFATTCRDHLAKGSQVTIEGRLQTREYEVEGVKKWITEVIISQLHFCGKKSQGSSPQDVPAPTEKDQ